MSRYESVEEEYLFSKDFHKDAMDWWEDLDETEMPEDERGLYNEEQIVEMFHRSEDWFRIVDARYQAILEK